MVWYGVVSHCQATVRTATSVAFEWSFACVLPSGKQLQQSDLEYQLMASVASAPTSEVYVGTATSFVVTAAAPPLGAASGTPIEVTVSYRGSPLPGTQFRGTSDATVATTLLTEPDVPPAPSATAKELFELSVSGTIAECVVPACWLCWGCGDGVDA